MSDHIFNKEELIQRLEQYRGKTFEEIDDIGLFEEVKNHPLQKGIAGIVVEQCIFCYPPDGEQRADLVIIDGDNAKETELKVTGMVIEGKPAPHFVAKEPMSITAVGVYDIAEQTFYTSHFWNKLQYMLILYYHYDSKTAVTAYEYKDFRLIGYEFHEFSEDDIQVLKTDWQYVRDLCANVVSRFDRNDKNWRENVKNEYIDVHGQLRQVLTYIDLAPKFPPRFRLKKPTVSAIIAKHFGYELEQLPGRYSTMADIDRKCSELTRKYKGRTISEIGEEFNISFTSKDKAVAERIIIAMFGGKSHSLREVELFQKFGIIGKSVTLTAKGGRTEDMKLFRCDFNEIVDAQFEDSELYSYFAHNELLCVIFEEPHNGCELGENRFVGFKRLVFSDEFIDNTVRKLWDDTRNKIIDKKLVDVIQRRADGTIITIGSGEVSSAPNFMKSRDNVVFMRGSGTDSSMRYKTECVNGIRMLPQYVWINGKAVIEELKNIPLL